MMKASSEHGPLAPTRRHVEGDSVFASLVGARALWTHLAWRDLMSRFRGTRLGAAWLIISQTVATFVVSFIWANLFGIDFLYFLAYVGIGIAVWAFLSSALVDGSESLIVQSSLFLNTRTPLAVAPMRVVTSAAVVMLLGLPVPMIASAASGNFQLLDVPVVCAGVALTLLLASTLAYLLALVAVRYRDIPRALSVLMQLGWVITPIIYSPEMLESRGLGLLVTLNPLAWPIFAIRSPLLDQGTAVGEVWIGLIALTICACAGAEFASRRVGRRILVFV